MSEGKRIAYDVAMDMALMVVRKISPLCDRVKVAGSLRRKKGDVGDIEIVCIPKEQSDLFGNKFRSADVISSLLKESGYGLHKDGEHYKQINLIHCMCDLFITTPECWGVIYMIRTGSADFSHKMVTPKRYGGFMPSHLKVKEGRLWNGDTVLDTPEEEDVFSAYGIDFIEPERRNA